jgi:hypothetical protein
VFDYYILGVFCDELEAEITEAKYYTAGLYPAILHEVFES